VGHLQLRRLEIIGSTISGNTATTGGAGIFNEGIATITAATISGNTAGTTEEAL